MITKEDIDKILCDALYALAEGVGGENILLKKINKKLPVKSEKIVVDHINFDTLVSIFHEIGEIIEIDKSNEECSAITKSGFLNMNFAVITAKMEYNKLCISAYAKEGLINQHTCQKVLNVIIDIINSINKK